MLKVQKLFPIVVLNFPPVSSQSANWKHHSESSSGWVVLLASFTKWQRPNFCFASWRPVLFHQQFCVSTLWNLEIIDLSVIASIHRIDREQRQVTTWRTLEIWLNSIAINVMMAGSNIFAHCQYYSRAITQLIHRLDQALPSSTGQQFESHMHRNSKKYQHLQCPQIDP